MGAKYQFLASMSFVSLVSEDLKILNFNIISDNLLGLSLKIPDSSRL